MTDLESRALRAEAERDALRAENERLKAERQTPDHAYAKPDWEVTVPWDDRNILEEDLHLGEVLKVGTLFNGPDKWAAQVPVTFDDDGDPDETEVRWFETEDEARAALQIKPEEG